jgi:nicotinate-nucleotide--dimethylbenzimidazole phosphoribosyltransferase
MATGHAECIARTAAAISSIDEGAAAEAARRHGRLTKPPGSLGSLEALGVRIAGITGNPRPRLDRRLIVVAAGDHGVARRGVSAYPPEVTAQMVANFLAGGAAINVLAAQAGARVRIVDAGVAADTPDVPELVRLRIAPGTNDITEGPAMSRDLADSAIAEGIMLFESEFTGDGVDLLGCGEMGIGNTTAAAAIVAAITGRPGWEVTGRGTGVDDEHYARKVEAVRLALEVNRPDPADGTGVLAAVGGFEIGVLAGLYLAAAAHRIPTLVDGVISGAAALIADAIAPQVRGYLLAAHRSAEPGHHFVLEHLELEPLLDFGMRLGEGSGTALAMPVCVAACRILDEMATFEEAGVSDSDAVVEHEV